MKTLKFGKKEYTVFDANEMFELRGGICSVMGYVDTMDDHSGRILTRIAIDDSQVKKRTYEDAMYISRMTAHAMTKCKLILELLRES